MEPACLLDRSRRPIPESPGTGRFAWPVHHLAIRSKSQTDLAGNGTVTRTDPDLCRTGLRMELARSQCRQIKTTSRCLSLFPSATEALKVIQARTTLILE